MPTRLPIAAAGLAAALALPGAAPATVGLPGRATVHVALAPAVAGRPAVKSAGRVRLPLGATTGSTTALMGTLTLKRGRHVAVLTSLRLTATARRAALSAVLRGRRVTLADGRAAGYTRGPTGPALDRTTIALTRTGAAALGRALHSRLRGGERFGTVALSAPTAPGLTVPATGTTPSPTAPAATTPAPTAPTPDPFASSCPISASTGGFSIGTPTPAPGDPAVDGTTATTSTTWGFKQSFRDYITASAPTSSVFAVAPATGTFTFPGSSGTVSDPASVPVRAVLHGTGTAVFCHRAHGFRIALADPTMVIDGAASYLSAEVSSNAAGTVQPAVRARVATLDAGAVTPAYDAGARTVTWSNVPATLHADVAPVFGGFYATGTALDAVTVVAQLP